MIPPIIMATAFHILFALRFLITNCSLMRASCSAMASGCVSSSIGEPRSWLTDTSNISASFVNNSASGDRLPNHIKSCSKFFLCHTFLLTKCFQIILKHNHSSFAFLQFHCSAGGALPQAMQNDITKIVPFFLRF